MRAVIVRRWGGPEVLELVECPEPAPRADEVVVEVHAAAINPRDWLIREGRYPFQLLLPRRPFVLGSDIAGHVVARGHKVRTLALGQPVLGMVPTSRGFGGYAERVAIPAKSLATKPESVSYGEAAGLPLAGLTAYQALVDDAGLTSGQRVLILGASGGVGTFAVQIARCLGAEVTGVSSEGNRELVEELGAQRTLDYRTVDPLDPATLDGGPLYDVVFDVIGKSSAGACRRVLAPGGVYVTTIPRPRQFLDLVQSRLIGLLRRSLRRSRVVMVRSRGDQLRQLATWLGCGELRTVIDSTFPLEAVAEAHARSRTFRSRGKIVLQIR